MEFVVEGKSFNSYADAKRYEEVRERQKEEERANHYSYCCAKQFVELFLKTGMLEVRDVEVVRTGEKVRILYLTDANLHQKRDKNLIYAMRAFTNDTLFGKRFTSDTDGTLVNTYVDSKIEVSEEQVLEFMSGLTKLIRLPANFHKLYIMDTSIIDPFRGFNAPTGELIDFLEMIGVSKYALHDKEVGKNSDIQFDKVVICFENPTVYAQLCSIF